MNYFTEAGALMFKLYGRDVVMALATMNGDKPGIRTVDAYFKDDSFYITTYALSAKIKELAKNPHAALTHELFVAHGTGENLGNPLKHPALRDELRAVFSAFYDKHVDEGDEHTCILRVKLKDALVFGNGYKYFIDFEAKTAEKEEYIIDAALYPELKQ